MRSHRSPRHVSRKDSSSEVNPMELPPAVPLISNVPSFLFAAQLKVCEEGALIRIFHFTILSTLNTYIQAAQSSPTTTAQPLSVPMATSSSSSSFSFATPKPLGTDSTTSSAGQQVRSCPHWVAREFSLMVGVALRYSSGPSHTFHSTHSLIRQTLLQKERRVW